MPPNVRRVLPLRRTSDRMSRELDDEIRFHIEMRAQELRASGLSSDEALAEALRRFGDVNDLRQYCLPIEVARMRRIALREKLHSIVQDLRFALRQCRRAPGFTSLAVLTTAIGIGATTTIFSVVNAVVLRPLPIVDADRVVRIYETNPLNNAWTMSEPNFLDYRARTRSFTAVTALNGLSVNLLLNGTAVALNGTAATASYWRLFGGRPIVGSVFTPDEDHPGADTHVVLLSEDVWRRSFNADPRVVGTSLDFDGIPYRVLGVMPKGYGYYPSDFWVPLAPDPASNRGSHLLTTLGRLAPGVTIEQANDDVHGVAAQLSKVYPTSNGQWGARVVSFLDDVVGTSMPKQLVLLLAAVGFLLLLACANVANLMLVRASTRRLEMSVRAALGAGGRRIARQLLTESVVLSVLGGLVGVALTWMLLPLIRHASGANVPRLDEVTLDPRVLAFAFIVAVGTGLLFGMTPALHALRGSLQSGLRDGGRSIAGAGRSVRDLLVGAEMTLVVVLLIGAGLLGRSFAKLQRVPPGFDMRGVLQLVVTAPNDLPRDQRAQFFRRIEEALSSVPGAVSVGATSIAPYSGNQTTTQFLAEGHEDRENDYFAADWRSVTPDLFQTIGVRLIQGRLLGRTDDASHPNVAVIDETMASKLWPGQNPLGKHIMAAQSKRTEQDRFEVVGVVRDIRDQSPGTDPGSAVYFTEDQKPWIQLTYFVRGRDASPTPAFVDAIRRTLQETVPTLAVPDITPLESNVGLALQPQRFTATLLTVFATVALLLAAIGLFGVVSFSVQQRVPEMGVRLALGAGRGQVVRLVMRQAGVVVAVGALVGCIAAASLSRLLASMLFGVSGTDAATYGAVIAVLLGTAALASYLPARRAAGVDPIVAMRAS